MNDRRKLSGKALELKYAKILDKAGYDLEKTKKGYVVFDRFSRRVDEAADLEAVQKYINSIKRERKRKKELNKTLKKLQQTMIEKGMLVLRLPGEQPAGKKILA